MSNNQNSCVYIGTYTRAEPFVDGKADGIYVFNFDQSTGELTYKAAAKGYGTVNPSYLAITPDRRFLLAVNEISSAGGDSGMVGSFTIDEASGGLRFVNQQSSEGFAPCHIDIDQTGRFALVANYETGNVSALPIGDDGQLHEASSTVQFYGSGPNLARQESPHAHMIALVPDSHLVLIADLGSDRIWSYTFEPEQGVLIENELGHLLLPPGTGARHLVLHPFQPYMYIISELQATILVYQHDFEQGIYQHIQTISTLPSDFFGEKSCAAIRIHPSGRFVYASNRGHNSIAVFAVDDATGQLSAIQHISTQGKTPRDFTLDASGQWLLVANQDSDTIVTMRVDSGSGLLSETGLIAQVPTPVCIRF